MGVEISRIEREFILSSLRKKSIPVKVHGVKIQVPGTVSLFEEDRLDIQLSGDDSEVFVEDDEVKVFFSYYGHVMTFETKIRKVSDGEIQLRVPESIHRDLQRKFERVTPPKGSSVEFIVQNARVVLDFPESDSYDPVEEPVISEDFDFDRIELLIANFRDKLRSMVEMHKITMFRESRPASFEERLISRTGRILYIPSTKGLGRFPEQDDLLQDRIITRAMLLRAGADADEPTDEPLDRLPSLLTMKRDQDIGSELYCPILFERYTVGYVYAADSLSSNLEIGIDVVVFVQEFTQILAFALKKNGYFEGFGKENGNFEARLIDISGAGLLFAHPDKQLNDLLPLYADMEIFLNIGDRRMRIGSRVMRKFDDSSFTYYGIQFLDIKPEDFRFLFEFVYGRAFTDEDSNKWEGGAEPPALNLD